MSTQRTRWLAMLAVLAAATAGCGDDAQTGDGGDADATDEGGGGDADADVEAEGDASGGPALLILEAESIPVNEYWVVCPGPDCEDDRSATASAYAHIMTRESPVTGGPEGRIRTTVALPFAGTWHLWARSARSGAERAWGASFDGTDVPSPFGTTSLWESSGDFAVVGTSRPAGRSCRRGSACRWPTARTAGRSSSAARASR